MKSDNENTTGISSTLAKQLLQAPMQKTRTIATQKPKPLPKNSNELSYDFDLMTTNANNLHAATQLSLQKNNNPKPELAGEVENIVSLADV